MSPAFSVDDAVVSLPLAALAVPQFPVGGVPVSLVPKTWNSQSEYPYWVARVTPLIRT